jgi:hypothetical protein
MSVCKLTKNFKTRSFTRHFAAFYQLFTCSGCDLMQDQIFAIGRFEPTDSTNCTIFRLLPAFQPK